MWSFYSRWNFSIMAKQAAREKPLQVMNLQFSVSTSSPSPLLYLTQTLTEKHSSGDSTVYQNPIGFHLVPCYRGQNKEGQTASEPLVSSPTQEAERWLCTAVTSPLSAPVPTCLFFTWAPHTCRWWMDHREWKKLERWDMACSIIQENTPRLIFYPKNSVHVLVRDRVTGRAWGDQHESSRWKQPWRSELQGPGKTSHQTSQGHEKNRKMMEVENKGTGIFFIQQLRAVNFVFFSIN